MTSKRTRTKHVRSMIATMSDDNNDNDYNESNNDVVRVASAILRFWLDKCLRLQA